MYYIVGDIGNTSTRICVLNENSQIIKSVIFDKKKIYTKGYTNKIFTKLLNEKIKKKFYFLV